jgi:peptidoglycan/LPS O-acetylase OafA/YrhL
MNRTFSAYLDVVRFLAALVVFLGHASTGYMTGGIFWQLSMHGDTCVVVFFVLSGFVIGYVADIKDKTWQLFLSNRAARLWSVVLPALLLTVVIDFAGIRIGPAIYDGPWFQSDHLLLRYLASSLMLQEVWHVWLVPGINGPFWSLTYEAFYYAAFGVLMFAKPPIKWICTGALLLAGGPLIAALFPIWGLGYFAYKVTKRMVFSPALCYFMFFSGIALLLFSPWLRAAIHYDIPVLGDPVLGRYSDGLGIFLNLIGAHGIAKSMPGFPAGMRTLISTVAGTTFVLYLFHRPLIQFFSYMGPSDSSSWQRRVLVLGGTLLITFLAVPMTELLRKRLSKRILRALPGEAVAIPLDHMLEVEVRRTGT